MATSARQLVGWTDARWAIVQEAFDKAFAGTAKCRQVVPKGPDMIGETSVDVPTIAAGPPFAYGPATTASPIHLYVDLTLDDEYAGNEAAITRLIGAASAQLGVLEDQEIVQGSAPAPAALALAPVLAPPAAGAPRPRLARIARNPGLARAQLNVAPAGAVLTAIGAGGANPTGAQLATAISTAVGALENAGRPGPYGLLLHNMLVATLRQPLIAGGAPVLQHVEQLIGSGEVAGTSALDSSLAANAVCGILFRLEPPGIDLVHTQQPTITVLGRTAGQTELRVEEEIVVRILDPQALHHITY